MGVIEPGTFRPNISQMTATEIMAHLSMVTADSTERLLCLDRERKLSLLSWGMLDGSRQVVVEQGCQIDGDRYPVNPDFVPIAYLVISTPMSSLSE